MKSYWLAMAGGGARLLWAEARLSRPPLGGTRFWARGDARGRAGGAGAAAQPRGDLAPGADRDRAARNAESERVSGQNVLECLCVRGVMFGEIYRGKGSIVEGKKYNGLEYEDR